MRRYAEPILIGLAALTVAVCLPMIGIVIAGMILTDYGRHRRDQRERDTREIGHK